VALSLDLSPDLLLDLLLKQTLIGAKNQGQAQKLENQHTIVDQLRLKDDDILSSFSMVNSNKSMITFRAELGPKINKSMAHAVINITCQIK